MIKPYQEFGKQQGKALLFAHANGFPPSTYTALLAKLGQHYRILAPHLRPLWQGLTEFQTSASNRAVWQQMAQDQNDFIEQHQLAPVTYIGHSMGANVGVLAAQLKPHLYSFIERQKGMFSFLGVNAEQVDQLVNKHSVYLVGSSRINLAGLNQHNIAYVAKSIAAVL